jgi:hypothetical protein
MILHNHFIFVPCSVLPISIFQALTAFSFDHLWEYILIASQLLLLFTVLYLLQVYKLHALS